MRQAVILAVVGALSVAGALGRDLPDDVVREPHRAAGEDAALAGPLRANPRGQGPVWVTGGQSDPGGTRRLTKGTCSPNLFDLNGAPLVFTRTARDDIARSQGPPPEASPEIGEEVESTRLSVIMLESFDFPFAGQRWDSLHLGSPGVMTTGIGMRQAVILAVVGALSVAGALGRDLPDDVSLTGLTARTPPCRTVTGKPARSRRFG